jgi:dTDP-4-dehydrorhamnose 3,5-epimerase
MLFKEINLSGVYLIELERLEDERGFFARTYCEQEFSAHGIPFHFVQCNISFNKHKGTLRGMHYQAAPYEEPKLVRCTMGAIYDVIIDIRPESPSFKRWGAYELTSENRLMLYIPAGFAHGFQTLVENSEVFYQMGEFYHPESACGIRWDDPAFGISWPQTRDIILSKTDSSFANFNDNDKK